MNTNTNTYCTNPPTHTHALSYTQLTFTLSNYIYLCFHCDIADSHYFLYIVIVYINVIIIILYYFSRRVKTALLR